MERETAAATDKLIVRLDSDLELWPVQPEDAKELFAAVKRNEDRLRQWLPWATPAYSLEDARRFLSVQAAENAAGVSLTMTIRHQRSICGSIALHKFDRANRNTSLGYWLDEKYQGKGIVTAACSAIVSEGFQRFGLHRIEIRCATSNHRSSAIPRRLGFVEEGILREAEWLHDKWVDLRVFSVLAQDWRDK